MIADAPIAIGFRAQSGETQPQPHYTVKAQVSIPIPQWQLKRIFLFYILLLLSTRRSTWGSSSCCQLCRYLGCYINIYYTMAQQRRKSTGKTVRTGLLRAPRTGLGRRLWRSWRAGGYVLLFVFVLRCSIARRCWKLIAFVELTSISPPVEFNPSRPFRHEAPTLDRLPLRRIPSSNIPPAHCRRLKVSRGARIDTTARIVERATYSGHAADQ